MYVSCWAVSWAKWSVNMLCVNLTAMSQLRGSQNYVWNVTDVLGQGATGSVYKCRHKVAIL